MEQQYYFLVVANYDEYTLPKKIFFNQDQAENYAKRLVNKLGDNYDMVTILRQEMCESGILKHFKTYYPSYEENSEVGGSDFDIDKGRWS